MKIKAGDEMMSRARGPGSAVSPQLTCRFSRELAVKVPVSHLMCRMPVC